MDLEDEGWVNIPYDGILEVDIAQKSVEDEPRFGNELVYVPSQLDHKEEIVKLPIVINESKETSHDPELDHGPGLDHCPRLDHGPRLDHDPVLDHGPALQVFFKKENQFVEMKMGSQESDLSHIEAGSFQYEEKSGDHVISCSSPSKMIKKEVVAWDESNQKLNFWKWGLSGIGAFCSLGMAAATICIITFGNGRRHKIQNQKLRIQIYHDNKRIKQVVQKANEAMRGVPLVNAQITYGGYYESL